MRLQQGVASQQAAVAEALAGEARRAQEVASCEQALGACLQAHAAPPELAAHEGPRAEG